jgi:hypothetical protein
MKCLNSWNNLAENITKYLLGVLITYVFHGKSIFIVMLKI